MGFSAGTIGSSAMALQAAGVGMSAIGAYSSAQSQKNSLSAQAAMAELNAQQAELAAQQELARGNAAVGQVSAKAGQIKSAQRASMAANGIDLGVGSAAEVLTSTDLGKENDINTINANAVRAAWGYRAQSTNYQNEALTKRATGNSISPLMAGATSLIGGAGNVAANWYKANEWKPAYRPDNMRGGN